MLGKKYSFVLVLLIIAITSLSAVSATDLNATDEVTGNEIAVDSELQQTDEGSLVGENVGTFTKLNNIISTVPPDATLTLYSDYSYVCPDDSDYQGGIIINRDITIKGNGHTIYGNGARVFLIEEDAKVTLEDFKFVNTQDFVFYNGGSIFNKGQLSLYNCEFINSSAAENGGAIYSSNSLLISSSKFENNAAFSSDEETQSAGGAIYSSGYLEVSGTDFMNNIAKFGGAICTENFAGVLYSNFFTNYAEVTGGAIYNDPDSVCLVGECSFYFNFAKYAGALYCGYDNESTFVGNNASSGKNMYKGVVIINTPKSLDADEFSNVVYMYHTAASPSKSSIVCGEKYNVKVVDTAYGYPVEGIPVEVKVKTSSGYKTFSAKTNANGIASIPVKNLIPGTYTVSITSAASQNFLSSSKTTKLTVKKGSAKITASNKAFKSTLKTKSYTITLKDSKGNAIKSATVKISVNGKTYSAKTNSAGKATFKINKLTKKGSFKSTIKFNGNSYYNKVSKTVTITSK